MKVSVVSVCAKRGILKHDICVHLTLQTEFFAKQSLFYELKVTELVCRVLALIFVITNCEC